MKRKIEATTSIRESIARAFGVTHASVCMALRFKRNSPQCVKIREMSLQQGGRLIEMHDVTEDKVVKILDSRGKVVKVLCN